MKNYKISKVLCPIDFSELSDNSLKTAIAICKRQKAKLTLIHVYETFFADESSNLKEEKMMGSYTQVQKKLLDYATRISEQNKIEIITAIEKGDPADVICEFAKDSGISMIILSAHGTSEQIEGIGQTALNIVKNAQCPVLSIHGSAERLHFKKIVYPIRMNQKIFEKFNYVESIIAKNNSELIIAGIADKEKHEHITEVVFSIDILREMCMEEKIPYSTVILPCSNFAEKVIETATKKNADMVVISSKLNYDANAKKLGFFAEQILLQATCSVLCISPLKPE